MPDDFESLNQALERILGGRVCEACGTLSNGAAHGWRTYRTIENQVASYCPKRPSQEFEHYDISLLSRDRPRCDVSG
jgi:hypothetical protein